MVTQPVPEWVLLSYRIPREPSTPRIAVWRKLKRLGVAQIGDGLVGLPSTPKTREQLEWVAASILEAAGEAIVWIATPTPRRQHAQLANQLTEARTAEYEELLAEIAATDHVEPRTIQKWRRAWRRIDRCDYFPTDLREEVRATINTHSQPSAVGSSGAKQ